MAVHAPVERPDFDGVEYATANDATFRVAIVDDHPMLCAGVADSFTSVAGFDVVGMAATAEGAVELAQRVQPDLMVIDINIPGDGIQAVRRISARFPEIRLMMLTAYEDAMTVMESLRAGASGYVLKGVSANELISAARSIMCGGSYVPPSLATELIGISRQSLVSPPPCNDESEPPAILSERETQILTRLSKGLSNNEIAAEIGVAEKTVKNHITTILRKLHVRNRVEAALMVVARRTPSNEN